MFSVPRNLENVPFPPGSPLQARFPTGFDCDDCLLNAVYTYAETNRRQLFPGVADPGPQAVKQAVSAALGIPVHYYVLVNLEGFRGIIDALGGITIRVERSL
jgi:anionic cell wall polymer biosynthesis LytR-Cps2A-Psr (LCP) family protein